MKKSQNIRNRPQMKTVCKKKVIGPHKIKIKSTNCVAAKKAVIDLFAFLVHALLFSYLAQNPQKPI